jgi:polyphosphate glucokinase
VLRAVEKILPIWNPRVLYIGGGNTNKSTVGLPRRVRSVDNIVGILGGLRIRDDEEP